MKLFFFKLKLALRLGIFILSLFANYSNKIKPLVLGIFIIGLLVLIGGVSLLTNQEKQVFTVVAQAPENDHLYQKETLTLEEMRAKIAFWEQVLNLQPNSRDVLINLSALYSTLGIEEEKGAEYKNSAFLIDPNNPLLEYRSY